MSLNSRIIQARIRGEEEFFERLRRIFVEACGWLRNGWSGLRERFDQALEHGVPPSWFSILIRLRSRNCDKGWKGRASHFAVIEPRRADAWIYVGAFGTQQAVSQVDTILGRGGRLNPGALPDRGEPTACSYRPRRTCRAGRGARREVRLERHSGRGRDPVGALGIPRHCHS